MRWLVPHAHPSQNLRDLAALLDPAGRCEESPADRPVLDWLGIYQLAAANLVSPILFLRLAETRKLHIVPPDVREALEEIFRLNQTRNARQRRILQDTIRILNADGVEPLLLKGSISLLPGQTDHAAARMMSDLDLLMVNTSPERAEQILLKAGYKHAPGQAPGDGQSGHHLAPLFHPSGEGYVEVHREAFMSKVPPGLLPFDELCADAQLVDWEGLRCWVPSLQHRLLHNIMHQQVQHARRYLPSLFSIRQLFDFSQLRCGVEAEGFDWKSFMAMVDRFRFGDVTRMYLLSAELLFSQDLPSDVVVSRRHRDGNQRMWWWVRHRRAYEMAVLAERLTNLPRRLMTPSWYPRKMRALLRQWRQRNVA